MGMPISTGNDDFEDIRRKHAFYVDKTEFIREWWESLDKATLITRPRRFGKTLNMSMLNCFFSTKYAGRIDLFEGLKIWEDEAYRRIQGTYPVLFVTFAGVKGSTYDSAVKQIKKQLAAVMVENAFLKRSGQIDEQDRAELARLNARMSDTDTEYALNLLSRALYQHYGKKVLIFMDEYDTPLQEAWIGGYWDPLAGFIRAMFNNTFKTNPALEMALMTGITRVSKESVFSDINNLKVVTTTSRKYASFFGFTENEVFQALDEQGFTETDKQDVKVWYDGFTFGRMTDIYNPWSITNYLDEGELKPYWANTSSNGLVSTLLQQGSREIKEKFETLLMGKAIEVPVNEQIIFNQLMDDDNAVWSLLLATGYLKTDGILQENAGDDPIYRLRVTNLETSIMFRGMVLNWFGAKTNISHLTGYILRGNAEEANRVLNDILKRTISYFDGGKKAGEEEPEKFYHGLMLGLLVDRSRTHQVKSNRESGYGRYDVVLEPIAPNGTAVIMEFKLFDPKEEDALANTCQRALKQIKDRKYAADLLARGIPEEHILVYGLGFRGKECLVMKG